MGSDTREGNGPLKRLVAALLALLLVGGVSAAIVWYVMPERDDRSPGSTSSSASASTPAPASRPAPAHRAISGVVHTADGKPAPGVQVALSTFQHPAVFQLNGQINSRNTVVTDSQGKFEFNTAEGPQALIARSDAGYASAHILELDSPTLVLQPWGRVDAMARRGTKPISNAKLTISFALPIPGRETGAYFQSNFNTTTDAEGRFVLDHLIEGTVKLGIAPRGQRGGAHLQDVIVHNGSTTTVVFGGKGRPVIGKLVPNVSSDLRQLTLMPVAPDPFAAIDPSKLSGPDLIAARREITSTPEYRQWLNLRRNAFQGQVEADGSFQIDEVTSGKYTLQATYAVRGTPSPSGMSPSEQVATARAEVTVDPIPEGTTDEPLDLGQIQLTVTKRMAIGQVAPDLSATDKDGKPVKLSGFRGRYVLLMISPAGGRGIERNSALRFGSVFDRFAADPRIAMLVVHDGPESETIAKEAAESGVRWKTAHTTAADPIPQEYASSIRSLLLIDPKGNLLAKSTDPLTAYGGLERELANAGAAAPVDQVPGVSVQAERVISSVAIGGSDYDKVAPPSADDAATNAEFKSIGGVPVRPPDSVDRLRDGKMQTSPDDPQNSFFYELGNVEGRLRIDLGKVIDIDRVNSYSWHKDDRAAQVYVLYGSPGTDPNFEPSPALGIDPTLRGWTRLAVVDTRPIGRGGRHAVSISHPGATLGKHRYLLLEIFPTETRDRFGQTFYGEIDVIEMK